MVAGASAVLAVAGAGPAAAGQRPVRPGLPGVAMARRAPVRQPGRHRQPRRAAGAGVAGHDPGDRRARPGHLRGCGAGDRGHGRRLDDRAHPGRRRRGPAAAVRRDRRGAGRRGRMRAVERTAGGQAGVAADHRHAGADGGRSRHRPAAQRWPDPDHLLRTVRLPRQRLPVRSAVLAVRGRAGVRGPEAAAGAQCAGPVRARDRPQPGSRARGRGARPRHHLGGLRVLWFQRGTGRAAGQFQRRQRRCQQRRPTARARRDPGGQPRRHRPGRRPLQPRRQPGRRADHPGADHDHLCDRRAAAGEPGGQGPAGAGGAAAAVAGIPRAAARARLAGHGGGA